MKPIQKKSILFISKQVENINVKKNYETSFKGIKKACINVNNAFIDVRRQNFKTAI